MTAQCKFLQYSKNVVYILMADILSPTQPVISPYCRFLSPLSWPRLNPIVFLCAYSAISSASFLLLKEIRVFSVCCEGRTASKE